MSDGFITCVQVRQEGLIEEVDVFVRGRRLGTLYAGKGDGERLKNALLGAKYFGIDRTADGPIKAVELVEWRVLAAQWLEVEEIVTIGQTGFVGRMVLRLLDALHATQTELDRTRELNVDAENTLNECHGALKAAALLTDITGKTFVPRPLPEASWLIKDFNVLYASARALADACNGRGDGRPYGPLRALESQLERLKPAFASTEETRAELAGRGGDS